jgi:hypothetical protein
MTLKDSNLGIPKPMITCTNSSRSDTVRAALSKIGSMLCGEDSHRAPAGRAHCHHTRLCAETPRAGGRVVEEGDVKLLQLVHELQSAFLTTSTLAMHLRQDDSRNQYLSWSSSQNMTYLSGQGRTSCKRISLAKNKGP